MQTFASRIRRVAWLLHRLIKGAEKQRLVSARLTLPDCGQGSAGPEGLLSVHQSSESSQSPRRAGMADAVVDLISPAHVCQTVWKAVPNAPSRHDSRRGFKAMAAAAFFFSQKKLANSVPCGSSALAAVATRLLSHKKERSSERAPEAACRTTEEGI